MSVKLYDEAIYNKIYSWFPEGKSKMRILKPDETARMFQINADLSKDEPLTLPLIAISRDRRVGLNIRTKRNLSYDGLVIARNKDKSIQLNAIPIELMYQIDIYTAKYEEADDLWRELVFNLVNHPKITITIPYNNINVTHNANLKLLEDIEDASDIPERIIPGEFTRWTLQVELQDGYIFSAPINKNYSINAEDSSVELTEFVDVEEEENHNGFTHINEEEI